MALFRRVTDGTDASFWQRLRPRILPLTGAVLIAGMLTIVCFWGRPTHLPALYPNTISRVNFSAPFDFDYDSNVVRERRVQEALKNLPPVYRVGSEPRSQTLPYRQLAGEIGKDAVFAALKKLPEGEQAKACAEFAEKLPGTPAPALLAAIIRLSPDSLACASQLAQTAESLERILRQGVYEDDASQEATLEIRSTAVPALTGAAGGAGGAEKTGSVARSSFIKSAPSRGVARTAALRNLADAIATQTAMAATEGVASPANVPSPRSALQLRSALFALFRPGVAPNIEIDLPATNQRREELSKQIGHVIVKVRKGDLLVERDKEISAAAVERWEAYRRELPRHNPDTSNLVDALRDNFLPVFAAVLFIIIVLRLAPPASMRRRHITLACVLVPANLLLIRFFLGLDALADISHHASALLSSGFFLWFAPPSLAALFLTLLGGWRLAAVGASAVSILSALMLGHSLDIFIVIALANMVAIRLCERSRSRTDIIRAGAVSGAVTAFAIVLVFQTNSGVNPLTTILQVTESLCGGAVSGLFVLGTLPLLERVFKLTSNFTYNELANSREPLLAKLQIIAPGTYNHSTNVGTLAENAARAIGANALLCHCAAYYHDIGKMLKPEYFVENQASVNPHETIPPAISATIIKSHVREGAELARASHLPRAIVEIIEQHHGSSLIEYFYNKALAAARAAGLPDDSVDPTTYRYQNAKPQSRESGIVLFADSIEAAARTLKHYNAKNIGLLVDRIVASRIADGQLDECPLTFREIQTIRHSLKDTLMHMYHHRVEYPGQHQPAPKAA